MKNKLIRSSLALLCAGAFLTGFAIGANAQDNPPPTPPPTPVSFFQSVGSYFTSNDTNLDLSTGKAELWTGMAYQSGVNFAADLGIRYKLSKPGAASGVALESVTRNAGIAGTIVSQNIGVAYCIYNHAIELSGGLDVGYRFDEYKPDLSVFLDARKALTVNTFAGLRLAVESDFRHQPLAPVFSVLVGFKL